MPRKPKSPYDHVWRKLRLKILARDGWRCFTPGCTRPATQVDHIVDITDAPSLRLDPSNLRAACGPCNLARRNRRVAALGKVNREVGTLRKW